MIKQIPKAKKIKTLWDRYKKEKDTGEKIKILSKIDHLISKGEKVYQ